MVACTPTAHGLPVMEMHHHGIRPKIRPRVQSRGCSFLWKCTDFYMKSASVHTVLTTGSWPLKAHSGSRPNPQPPCRPTAPRHRHRFHRFAALFFLSASMSFSTYRLNGDRIAAAHPSSTLRFEKTSTTKSNLRSSFVSVRLTLTRFRSLAIETTGS